MKIINALLFPPVRLNAETLRRTLRGKTVLITGASYGIGEALSYLLAHEGVHLILIARTLSRLEEVKRETERCGATTDIFALDLRDEEKRKALIVNLQDNFKIDIFVSNAGKSIRRPLVDALDRFHDYQRTMALNYFTPVELCLGLFDMLQEQRGQIVNISAVNVLLPPVPGWTAYQASKCAFDQWFRAAAPELRQSGICATSVYFPLVRTRMIAPTRSYQNAPAMSADRAARIIACTLVKRSVRYKPWWLKWAQFGAWLVRPFWDKFSAQFFLRNKHE